MLLIQLSCAKTAVHPRRLLLHYSPLAATPQRPSKVHYSALLNSLRLFTTQRRQFLYQYMCMQLCVCVFVCRKQRTKNKYRNMRPSLSLSLFLFMCVYELVFAMCNRRRRERICQSQAQSTFMYFLSLNKAGKHTHMQNAINQRTICIDRTSHDVAVTASSLKAHLVQIWFPHYTNSIYKWWQRASLWTRLCTKVTSCAT